MKTVLAWMDNEVEIIRMGATGPVKQKRKIVERFAELVAVNGGSTNITQFGQCIPDSRAPYGRIGLVLPEALELINLNGIMHGFFEAFEDDVMKAAAVKKIQTEILRVKSEGFDPLKNTTPLETEPKIEIHTEAEVKAIEKVEKDVKKLILP